VVLHPKFVNGKYAFYTRPQDSFIDAGKGGGIGFGLSTTIENAVMWTEETVIDKKAYHTVYEAKNGQGPAPIKTPQGWLHYGSWRKKYRSRFEVCALYVYDRS
jgi:4-O-beta-D-mannosyl-D-glucose phosphorylase